MNASTVNAIFDAMQSHALKSGYFERVNKHEPKNAPPSGLSAAIWVDYLGPAESGLASTSTVVRFNVRIYQNMISEPQDAIDPSVLTATAALMEDYSGDFTLGGNVRNVDLLGMTGTPLEARAGYINQDGQMMRTMTITVPAIVNDQWSQAA